MKIIFSLGWAFSGLTSSKDFKNKAAYQLFEEYLYRISKFSACTSTGSLKDFNNKSEAKLWICERSKTSQNSNEIAAQLDQLMNTNCKELLIAIGGPDGFSENEIKKLNPDFRWSFGALTLPYELAAVVASEQIYRAWTILKNLPYHTGH